MVLNRKERLEATLKGLPVDRPAVNFYEIGGYTADVNNPDPYNVYNSPSWQPLFELAYNETDIIKFTAPAVSTQTPSPMQELTSFETWEEGNSRFSRMSIKAGSRTLSTLTRLDRDVDTTWTLEHLLKDADDAQAYLDLPEEPVDWIVDPAPVLKDEEKIGDSGIVMLNAADPICAIASLFDMGEYTIIAMTEQELFHRMLQKAARYLHSHTKAVAEALPGRLWRVCGPEYASEPYLPPRLFRDYVHDYTKPQLDIIKANNGFARLHSHGRLRNILSIIADMGPDGLDPIEPPNQGDMELWEVKEQIGQETVLFGNLEISDIENMDCADFEKVVAKALREGTTGGGKGFVLMPSSAPYGREITPKTLANYQTMVRLAKLG